MQLSFVTIPVASRGVPLSDALSAFAASPFAVCALFGAFDVELAAAVAAGDVDEDRFTVAACGSSESLAEYWLA